MADDRSNQNRENKAPASGDSDAALREELEREEKEAKGGIGDVARDRNLSGSSSWLTEPKDSSGRARGSGSDDGRPQR